MTTMTTIRGSVGRGGNNNPGQVRIIQELLNRHRPIPLAKLAADDRIGPKTIAAIEEFQQRVVKMPRPDGRVDPGGGTLRALSAPANGHSARLPTAGLSVQQQQKLLAALDRICALKGTGVAFVGRGMSQIVRPAAMPSGLQTWIVLVEEEGVAPRGSTRPSKLGEEFLKFGLSCGATVLAGVAVAGSAAAAPLTAGTSSAVTVLSWGAAVASSAQCGVSAGRLINEVFEPQNNDWLDSQTWFETADNLLDGVSAVGGLTALGQTAQAAIRLSKTSGRPLKEILKGMDRAQRKRLAQDLARYSGEAPTRRTFVRLAREGKIPKIFTSEQVKAGVVKQTLEAIGAGLDLANSAAFGVINKVAVYFVEEG